MSQEDVKKLLLKHDYITRINKTGDGCIITYPHPKLLYPEWDYARLIECVAIQRGVKPGFWVNTTYDKPEEKDRFISVPEYAMRLYIVCEVASCNARIPIDPTMLVFFNEQDEEQEDIESIIPDPLVENDRKLEGFLYGLIVEARNDGFPPEYGKVAETHSVGDGYNLIKRFYIADE